jgi:hypothetical protein
MPAPWISLTLLAATAVATASTITVNASCPLAPVTVTTPNSATCGPANGDFASGLATLAITSANTERTQFEGLFIGPAATGDFSGSYTLTILGGSGGGLYTPAILLTIVGDISDSASAYAKWNDRFAYRDTTGDPFSSNYCLPAYVAICGTPFTFGVPIHVDLELFAHASAGGRFSQQFTSASTQFTGIATFVDEQVNAQAQYSLIEAPEPKTFILLGLGCAILSIARIRRGSLAQG